MNSSIERDIKQLEHDWIEAIQRRDQVVLDRIIGDDFLLSGWLPGATLADKQTYVEDCLRPVEVSNALYEFDQWKIRTYGDSVVVNCVFSCRAVVGGNDWGGDFQFTDVWVRRDNRWQVVTRHSSSFERTKRDLDL